MRHALKLLALGGVVLTLAACGKERPTEAVHKTVDRFGKAVADKDYQELCDNLLAGNLIVALEERGVPCELALKTGFGNVKDPKISVRTVAVNGDKALVTVGVVDEEVVSAPAQSGQRLRKQLDLTPYRNPGGR